MKKEIKTKLRKGGDQKLKGIDVQTVKVFDLKKGSRLSAQIHTDLKDYLKGLALVKFQIGVMSQNMQVYKSYINANNSIGKDKMDLLVKLVPNTYYVATRRLHPRILYL